MTKYIPFNPKIHKLDTLYQYVSIRTGSIIGTSIEKTDVPYDVAKETPWYFLVEK